MSNMGHFVLHLLCAQFQLCVPIMPRAGASFHVPIHFV
jgi:hypothetical protein